MHKSILKLQSAMPYLFAILIIIVTFLMLIELPQKQGGWPYWDKVQHILVFMTLALFGFAGFSKRIVWICAGLIVYGSAVEHLQGALTVTRLASFGDWFADIAGIMLAALLWLMFKNYLAHRNIALT